MVLPRRQGFAHLVQVGRQVVDGLDAFPVSVGET